MEISVIYIAGPARSGSTLLSRILGEIPGFFNGGEIVELFNAALLSHSHCGCGVPTKECSVWQEVFARFCCNRRFTCMEELCLISQHLAHSWKMPWIALLRHTRSSSCRDIGLFLDNLSSLYHSIASVGGCRYIVDASKNTGYAYLLNCAPDIRLFMIHLIRDPRSAVFSWMKKKEGLWTENPVRASLAWNLRNLYAEALGKRLKSRYVRVRYEDLVAAPRETVNRILEEFHLSGAKAPFQSRNEVYLTVFGNPDRFQKGLIRSSPRDTWKGMSPRARMLVTLLTWPLALRYRYPLRTPRPRGQMNTGRRISV